MLRKPQCDYGWDWNIALAPLGVYGRIALVGPDGEIGTPLHPPAPRERPSSSLHVDFPLHGDETLVTVALARHRDRRQRRPRDRPRLRRAHPRSTPHSGGRPGSGDQPLHTLVITAGALTRTTPVALRDIRLVSEPDATGRSFEFQVNGRDIFARGANWIPADALPGRITDAATRDLLAIRRRRPT